MINTNERTNKLIRELQKTVPEFNIKLKSENLFLKLINYILFFNKQFMEKYTTTIGNTVYFPSQKYIENSPQQTQIILAHEFVHVLDSKNNILFKILYLFPQILFPIFLIAFLLLSGILSYILLFMAIICLSPVIPAYWRSKYELRGYQMSLFAFSELSKESNNENIEKILMDKVNVINTYFTGSGYYWMNLFGIKSQLINTVEKIKTDDILNDDISYNIIRTAFKNSRN
jgi:hypothetical protein